jgi:hypothetical protein
MLDQAIATSADVTDLRTLSLDELALIFDATGWDDPAGQAVISECARRDRADRASKARASVREQWHDGAYAQYLAADSECRGYLFSREGEAAGIDPWPALWTGPEPRAMRYASEELREFWYINGGRTTVTQYGQQLRDARRIARDDADLAGWESETTSPAAWQALPGGGRIRETHITAAGERHRAWWAISPDGVACLRFTSPMGDIQR